MHKIRFPLGLCWRELTDPLAAIKGPTSNERGRGREGEEGEWKGKGIGGGEVRVEEGGNGAGAKHFGLEPPLVGHIRNPPI